MLNSSVPITPLVIDSLVRRSGTLGPGNRSSGAFWGTATTSRVVSLMPGATLCFPAEVMARCVSFEESIAEPRLKLS